MRKRLDDEPLPNIPDRFGRANWARYEAIIGAYLDNYPNELTFKPSTSQATGLRGIRDAVRAFLHKDNSWGSLVDKEKLRTVWEKTFIKPIGKLEVRLSPERALAPLLNETDFRGAEAFSPTLDDFILVDAGAEPDIVLAFATLKSKDYFKPPVTIFNITPDKVSQLHLDFPNLLYEPSDSANSIILL